jgi:hypothetical protein
MPRLLAVPLWTRALRIATAVHGTDAFAGVHMHRHESSYCSMQGACAAPSSGLWTVDFYFWNNALSLSLLRVVLWFLWLRVRGKFVLLMCALDLSCCSLYKHQFMPYINIGRLVLYVLSVQNVNPFIMVLCALNLLCQTSCPQGICICWKLTFLCWGIHLGAGSSLLTSYLCCYEMILWTARAMMLPSCIMWRKISGSFLRM